MDPLTFHSVLPHRTNVTTALKQIFPTTSPELIIKLYSSNTSRLLRSLIRYPFKSSMQTRKRRKGFESKPTTSARAARAWREMLKVVLPSHFQDLISLVLSYCGVGIAGNLLAIRPDLTMCGIWLLLLIFFLWQGD